MHIQLYNHHQWLQRCINVWDLKLYPRFPSTAAKPLPAYNVKMYIHNNISNDIPMTNQIYFEALCNDKILQHAKGFAKQGTLNQQDNYCYLKVNDNYIHALYPFLSIYGDIKKPNYFNSPDGIGAHISVIYPEEGIKPVITSSFHKHDFSVVQFGVANYQQKSFYVLIIHSYALERIRKQYMLHPMPLFQKQRIFFHITIGVGT